MTSCFECCRGCTKRKIGCHNVDTCEDWRIAQDRHIVEKKAKDKDVEIRGYIFDYRRNYRGPVR